MERNNKRDRRRKKGREFLEFFADAGDFGSDDDFYDDDRPAGRQKSSREREYPARGRGKSRKRESNAGRTAVILFFLAVILIAAGLAAFKVYQKYSYSKQTMALTEYFKVSSDTEVPLIIDNEMSDVRGAVFGDSIYVPLSFANEKMGTHFYYEQSENKLLYAEPDRVYVFAPDTGTYSDGIQSYTYDKVIWTMGNMEPYLEVGFLSGYVDLDAHRYEDPVRLSLYLHDCSWDQVYPVKDTAIRYQGGVKSDILKQVTSSEPLMLLEELEDWDKVMSADGIAGYIEKKDLGEKQTGQMTVPDTAQQSVYTSLTRDHRINMAWHQVTGQAANDTVYDLIANTKDVNVISPTWYFLSDNMGGFTTIANQQYVADMHQRGIEVWALIDNFTNDVDIEAILSTYANRQRLITDLVSSATEFGIDGINVDFELVPQSAGEEYVEFIRELSVGCRNAGLVLSIDNYVPGDHNEYYGRDVQGQVADYVVIMGYDEHYAGSQEAGSVASLGYVQYGIEKTISRVPERKVINGIPFYTRFWRTGGGEVSSEALTMGVAKQALEKRGIEPQWDETTSQYYAAFDEDGKFCQIWLEDKESIRAKLQMMSQYDLGGVAEWKLGQESSDVWDEIAAYMAGELGSPVSSEDMADDSANAGDIIDITE
ncbi:MAG: hypothetical protein J5842_04620 [Lachnospiraceae bacterium]|nr:hypothetical protein [Lachnospiraceae bacterium]